MILRGPNSRNTSLATRQDTAVGRDYTEHAGPMPKYTKLLPPNEYDKLTLEEKGAYIDEMAALLKPRIGPPAPGDPNSPLEDPSPAAESVSLDQQSSAPADPNPPDDTLKS